MKAEELKDLIIGKQDELIKLWKAPRYNEVWVAALRLAKELDALKHQLKESELAPVENVSDYLNECIEKAAPNLNKIEDVDKEVAEIRGENHNCYNCKFEYPNYWGNPCSYCKNFNKWEPKLKQVESEPVKESAEISDEDKECENCKYYSYPAGKYPCTQCDWGENDLKWEPKTE